MSGPVTPPLEVSDVADGGSVTGRPITTIEVTDGTLSVSGRTATITTGGGGGSGTVTSITAAAESGTGTAITTSGTFTFTGGTGITTSVSDTTVTIVADNNGDVTATGTPVDNQLAIWDSATSIEGDANLTWDGSTLTVTGALDIDNIKVDGNTISSTDTDGAIDLSPNGSGVVTMYNAYRFPTAVTSTDDYVLTAQTDGTTAWAEVSGGVSFPLEGTDGSAAAPTYSFASDTDTGLYLAAAGQLALTSGGTQIMTMASGAITVPNNGKFRVDDGGATNPTISFISDTDLGFYRPTTNTLGIVADGEQLRITGSGEIGIGGANYGTDGQVLTSGGAGAAVAWEDAGGGGGSPGGSDTEIQFNDGGSFGGNAAMTFDKTSGDEQVLISASSTVAPLKVVQTGAGNAFEVFDQATDTTVFAIRPDGKVGILTTPSGGLTYDLQIGGETKSERYTSSVDGLIGSPAFRFQSDGDCGMYLVSAGVLGFSAGGSNLLEMQHDGTATDFRVGTGSGDARITADGTQNLVLQTNDGTTSGTIQITHGADESIAIRPEGTGKSIIYSPQFGGSDPPASSGATGTAGQLAYDADYIYVCTATDTWARAAIATW